MTSGSAGLCTLRDSIALSPHRPVTPSLCHPIALSLHRPVTHRSVRLTTWTPSACSPSNSTGTGPTSCVRDWAYLTSLEWVAAKENLALIGPAGTGKSHTLIALGHAAVTAGHRVKYLTAADLIENLYRGLADNTVGKTIESLLRHDLLLVDEVGFAPLDDTGAQLLFRVIAAAYERRSLGIASHFSFEEWGRFLPEHTTAVSMLDRLLHHATTVVTSGQSYRMLQARTRTGGRPTTS